MPSCPALATRRAAQAAFCRRTYIRTSNGEGRLLALGLTFEAACSVPVTTVGGGGLVPQPVVIETLSSKVGRSPFAGRTLRIPNVFIAALLCRKDSQQRPVPGVT